MTREEFLSRLNEHHVEFLSEYIPESNQYTIGFRKISDDGSIKVKESGSFDIHKINNMTAEDLYALFDDLLSNALKEWGIEDE